MISKFAVVVRASEETFFALRTFVNWKYYVRGGYLRIINSDSIGTLFALDLLKFFTKISQPLNMVYPNDIILAYSLFVILDLSGDWIQFVYRNVVQTNSIGTIFSDQIVLKLYE